MIDILYGCRITITVLLDIILLLALYKAENAYWVI